jgi:hypothetical protein
LLHFLSAIHHDLPAHRDPALERSPNGTLGIRGSACGSKLID